MYATINIGNPHMTHELLKENSRMTRELLKGNPCMLMYAGCNGDSRVQYVICQWE